MVCASICNICTAYCNILHYIKNTNRDSRTIFYSGRGGIVKFPHTKNANNALTIFLHLVIKMTSPSFSTTPDFVTATCFCHSACGNYVNPIINQETIVYRISQRVMLLTSNTLIAPRKYSRKR